MSSSVAIIGGGAAGLMAAAAVKEFAPAVEIFLFEKNLYLGAKVIISGGGRCNVTTGIFDVRRLLENYPRGAQFLMSALYRFPPEKVMAWFEDHGVPLKIEDDLRVFPASDNGKDVVGALEKNLRAEVVSHNHKRDGVKIFVNANVVSVQKNGEKFQVMLQDGTKYEVDKLIITTGGNAYRHTGSTGDGYAFAKKLGHTITHLAPSLNSFLVKESWVVKLAGVSFAKALLSFGGHERIGPFLFTHHGVSGPAVFALSSLAAYEIYSKEKTMDLRINFFPDETPHNLKKRFQSMADKNGRKFLVNFLDLFLPKSLCGVITEILKIDPKLVIARLHKDQREAILKLLQHFILQVTGRAAGDEFVTAGGVDLKEVNTNTMESKICPGLFFAGEILDVDGFTGGFNLQASWATGHLAGENIAYSMSGK